MILKEYENNKRKGYKSENILTWCKVRNQALIGKTFVDRYGFDMHITIEKAIRNRRVNSNLFIIKLFGPFTKSGVHGVIRTITVSSDLFDETILELQKDINKNFVKSEKIILDMNINKLRTLLV